MLEFTKVFSQGTRVTTTDKEEVMKCKNIEFDHVAWSSAIINYNNLFQIVIIYYRLFNKKRVFY